MDTGATEFDTGVFSWLLLDINSMYGNLASVDGISLYLDGFQRLPLERIVSGGGCYFASGRMAIPLFRVDESALPIGQVSHSCSWVWQTLICLRSKIPAVSTTSPDPW